jgi:hypothetical protein
MDYQEFAQVLNRHIFYGNKRELLVRLASNPERFIGLFRPSKPSTKILQHLLQSYEIRMGDALEEIIGLVIQGQGYILLDKNIQGENNELLRLDQYFTDGKKYYFIEQKIRDDHDSTKKRGQMQNFEKKLKALHRKHGSNLVGIMYFIDPDFSKNKNYYQEEIQKLRGKYEQVEIHLFYVKQLFEYLGIANFWDQMLSWLKKWKEDLPEIPEINFDANPYESFMEVKDTNLGIWQKIISNDKLWEEGIIKALFRTGDTLKLIQEEFGKMEGKVYKRLADDIKEKLVKYYGG